MSFLLSACHKKEVKKEEKRVMHQYSVFKEGIPYQDELWQEPTYFYDSRHDLENAADIKALWIRSDYEEQESYAFAYLGYPKEIKKNMPAVLLLHGGAGTAYYEWVQKWNALGYVALAVDLEGNVPIKGSNMSSPYYELYTNSEYHTPKNKNHADSAKEVEKTWMHYATRTAIIANSFLHHLEEVDPYKIGVVGVSWGGILTSVITGYDDRLAFSVPIYCTLDNKNTDSNMATYLKNYPEASIWDETEAISKVNTPILILGSNVDKNSRLDSLSSTYSKLKNGYLSIIDGMLHAQAIAVDALEPYIFAEAILKKQAYAHITSQPEDSINQIEVNMPKGLEIEKVYLLYTTDEPSVNNTYSRIRLTHEKNQITFESIEEARIYFVNIILSNGQVISTKVIKK